MKKLIALTLVIISLFALTSCKKATETPVADGMTCTVEVDCTEAIESGLLSESKLAALPADGKIIKKREVSFSNGETVFDVLFRELRADKIHIHYANGDTKGNKYIKAISNLYQLRADDYSGWNYYVNGEMPTVSSGEYKVSEGDEILFVFVEDFTKER